MNPIFVAISNNRFRCRSHDKFFFKFCIRINNNSFPIGIIHQSIMGHYCTFFCKVFYVLSFFIQKRFWNKYRKICIYMSRVLKHFIQHISDIFSERESVGFDYHTSSNCRIFCQLLCNFVVPLAIIFTTWSEFCHRYLIYNKYNYFL